jgi:uncharacterized protein (TIGR03089 family)
MHLLSTPEQLFADLLRARPSDPFVTYYDEASGARAELSAKSMANWVAKTHHLLADELGLGAGDTAAVELPAHWLSVPVVLGCLTAGLQFVGDGRADISFHTDEDRVAAANPLGICLQLAGFEPEEPDYVAAARPQPDTWPSVQFGATAADACLPGRTRAEVGALAVERAAALGLGNAARVLSTRTWSGPDDWIDTLFAPLAAGGSVVYVANCAEAAVLDRRAAQERVTNRV